MARWDLRSTLLVLVSLAVLLGLLGGLALEAGRPYPGFFVTPDYYVVPVESAARAAGLRAGDRLVAVEGDSPLTLAARRAGRRRAHPLRGRARRAPALRRARAAALDLEPAGRPLRRSTSLVSAIMLIVGAAVFVQNPAAAPNRRFLLYMCLWAVSNVAVPEAVLGARPYAAALVGLLAPLLSIHGWVFFLTYPANADRERVARAPPRDPAPLPRGGRARRCAGALSSS